jgi:hypothetical protein
MFFTMMTRLPVLAEVDERALVEQSEIALHAFYEKIGRTMECRSYTYVFYDDDAAAKFLQRWMNAPWSNKARLLSMHFTRR